MRTYESAKVAVDAAIFTVLDGTLSVYLHRREKDPFKDQPELLGGLLLPGETAEQTLQRKVEQTIPELQSIYFEQFFTFTEPARDPRARTVSIGFYALVCEDEILNTDRFSAVAPLKNLAFDHLQIIRKAKQHLADRRDLASARFVLPKYFPLNALHRAVEALHGTSYDNRNFRRTALASGLIRETNRLTQNVSHRPAKLYEFVTR